MTVTIRKGDCREVLKVLPDQSVHCCVTSPPYWGLRDYGVEGQLGLERSLGEYIEVMVGVFREVKRVLRNDGTLWLNLGDSYAASPNRRAAADIVNDDRTFRDKPFSTIGPVYDPNHRPSGANRSRGLNSGSKQVCDDVPFGRIVAGGTLKPKDLCGIPWRVAFALQADGWWLRQDIIWAKPNPMPESVTDRCTKAHEYIFLLTKNARYYYDAEAIAEDSIRAGDIPGGGAAGRNAMEPRKAFVRPHNAAKPVAETRNKRSVWEIATAPFSEAHFATFPPALIESCIKAGCPKGGTVLDLFGGAGTTGLVADRLGRDAILIELNPEYIGIAERRLSNDAGMFSNVQLG